MTRGHYSSNIILEYGLERAQNRLAISVSAMRIFMGTNLTSKVEHLNSC